MFYVRVLFRNKTQIILERTKILSWVPTGPVTEHDCAGEDPQQFTETLWYAQSLNG
jgi:hypothetical protein